MKIFTRLAPRLPDFSNCRNSRFNWDAGKTLLFTKKFPFMDFCCPPTKFQYRK